MIENELKKTASSFDAIYENINTIFTSIAALDTMRVDMENTGNYTGAYINDLIEKETANKTTPNNAACIDKIEIAYNSIFENIAAIIGAPDALENTKLNNAISIVSNLKAATPDALETAKRIASDFRGVFPCLDFLASVAVVPDIAIIFASETMTLDALEILKDNTSDKIGAIKRANVDGDMREVFTRLVSFTKDTNSIAYKLDYNNETEYQAIDAAREKAQFDAVKKAMML